MAADFYVSTHQPCTTRLLSGECEQAGEVDRARNWRRSAVSGVASKSDRRPADLDFRRMNVVVDQQFNHASPVRQSDGLVPRRARTSTSDFFSTAGLRPVFVSRGPRAL